MRRLFGVDPEKRVNVYRNLHKPGFFSVRQNGRVVTHRVSLCLHDCWFRVQPAGHKRVIESGRKNVHAYASGFVAYCFPHPPAGECRQVTYRPEDGPSFYCAGEPIQGAPIVWMDEGRFLYVR